MDSQDLDFITDLLEREAGLKEKLREEVNELDKKTRAAVGVLNKIHYTPPDAIPSLLDNVRPTLTSCSETFSALANLVPPNQFWRWKDMWSNSLRSGVFCATLVEFLSSGRLLTLPETSGVLGIREEWSDRFTLSVDDYLHGLITLVNELSRLAVNAVTLGNFEEPLKISIFVKELFSGFSMLNLKNDTLRRRFDSLKYDIKKIEEVVYDVSLRKLVPSQAKT